MKPELQKSILLNNGQRLPLIGLGTYMLTGKEAEDIVYAALMKGYRLIDTASMYGNEEAIGAAIRRAVESGIAREDISVVTKIWKTDMGYRNALKAFEKSYELMKLEYIDLLLIHWPASSQEVNIATWKALEEIYYGGKVRSIGVSNFDERHLKHLFKWVDIKPAVNQFSSSPGYSQEALRAFCAQEQICSMAYSPIHRGTALTDKDVIRLAEKYRQTPAQIALRWHIQRGVIPIPKTADRDRLEENRDLFDFSLSADEVALLLGKG